MNKSFKLVDLEQRSKEWLEWRRNYIMASDAPIIMGVSKYQKTVENLLQEKSGSSLVFQKVTSSMKKGVEWEDHLLKNFEKLYNTNVHDNATFRPAVVQSLKYEYCAASLDGLSHKEDVAVEIKVTNAKNHQLATEGILPEEFVPQVQHQMLVLNIPHLYYVSYFIPEKSMRILKIYRDENYIQTLIHNYSLFLNDLDVLKNSNIPQSANEKQESILYGLISYSKKLDEKISKLESEKKYVRELILNLVNHTPFVSSKVKVSSHEVKGRINYSSIPKDHELYKELEHFRSPPSQQWRFAINEENKFL